MLLFVGQPFERDDRLAGDVADIGLTGTHSHAVDLNGAGSALGYPAAVFGARDAEFVPQHPEQRHLGNDVNLVLGSIDRDLDHVGIPLGSYLFLSGANGLRAEKVGFYWAASGSELRAQHSSQIRRDVDLSAGRLSLHVMPPPV